MKTQNIVKGRFGEDLARIRLESEGMKMLFKNYRNKWGEIDLIMVEGRVLVFVEVKLKSCLGYGLPEEMINRNKLRRIRTVAQGFLMENNGIKNKYQQYRIDAVCLVVENNNISYFRHYRNLF